MERFANIEDNELQRILDERHAVNTQKANLVSFNVFKKYCLEKKFNLDLVSILKFELDELLKSFYVEARKEDGTMYKKTSLGSLRFGIQRYLKKVREDINIIDDPEFKYSNEVYKAQCVQLKKAGLAKVNHKPEISKSDLSLLYSSGVFSTSKPSHLQKKVFFEVMLYLCRRGRENLRNLTTDSFVLKSFEDGKKYIVLTRDELTKNNRVDDEYYEGGRIVETSDENCPVASFILYVSKLNPRLKAFFQRPKENTPLTGPWFDNQVVGVKTLEKLMKIISKEAGLSQIYTNHCIRATCITLLDSAGFEARHIMSVSGHKSESSIRSYAKTNAGIKRKMASTISSAVASKKSSFPVPKHRNFNFGIDYQLEEKEELAQEVSSLSIKSIDEKPPQPSPSITNSNNPNNPISSSVFHDSNYGEISFSNCTFSF